MTVFLHGLPNPRKKWLCCCYVSTPATDLTASAQVHCTRTIHSMQHPGFRPWYTLRSSGGAHSTAALSGFPKGGSNSCEGPAFSSACSTLSHLPFLSTARPEVPPSSPVLIQKSKVSLAERLFSFAIEKSSAKITSSTDTSISSGHCQITPNHTPSRQRRSTQMQFYWTYLSISLTCGTADDAWSDTKPARKVSSIKKKSKAPWTCRTSFYVLLSVPHGHKVYNLIFQYAGCTVLWNQSGTQVELGNSTSKPASQNGRISFPCSSRVSFSLSLLALRGLRVLLGGFLKVTKTQTCC